MRDYWLRDPRNELARYMEDCFLNELARTGEIKDLDLTASDVIEGAKKYAFPADPSTSSVDFSNAVAVAENAFVCSKIDEAIARMNWGEE